MTKFAARISGRARTRAQVSRLYVLDMILWSLVGSREQLVSKLTLGDEDRQQLVESTGDLPGTPSLRILVATAASY